MKHPDDLDSSLVQLFNLETDSSETTDIAESNSKKVGQLLRILNEFQSKAAPLVNATVFGNCDPARNGGVWGPF